MATDWIAMLDKTRFLKWKDQDNHHYQHKYNYSNSNNSLSKYSTINFRSCELACQALGGIVIAWTCIVFRVLRLKIILDIEEGIQAINKVKMKIVCSLNIVYGLLFAATAGSDIGQILRNAPYLSGENVIEIPACKEQGIIKIRDRKDPPVPRTSEDQPTWKICGQFQGCSCCNTSHVNVLYKSWNQKPEYQALSPSCKQYYVMMHCKTCDPNLGVQGTMHLCKPFCNHFFDSCRDDFFTYDQVAQKLKPCSDSPDTTMCSYARDLVKDGKEFCYTLGHVISIEESCFDGVGDEQLCKYVLELEEEAIRLEAEYQYQAMRAAIKIALMAIGIMLGSIILFPPGGGAIVSGTADQIDKKQQ
eukprot:TRINITY_DN1124_c1_g1_i1.p1 TRINITY_DN1124_c1_g1~~TRINITY_DN1124_c1_g1_i1.p1  ORF type:complete len:360 (-),score=31.62 TRINITY_DN1124_c1_g1_i1:236-1315(-)